MSLVKLLAALACLTPLAALAQMSPQDMMGQGLYRLAQADRVSIESTGFELRGQNRVELRVTVSLWNLPAEDKVKLEVMSFENGKLVTRQAADGHSLWDFDVRSNTYSSVVYADEEGLTRDWKQRVFRTLRLRTTGITAFTVRLMDDAFGTGLSTGQWSPWIPVSTVTRVDKSIACIAGSPNPNDTLYLLDGSDDEGWTLLGANYDQYDKERRRLERRWEMTVSTGRLQDNYDFGFVPPRGAKVVAIDQRSGG